MWFQLSIVSSSGFTTAFTSSQRLRPIASKPIPSNAHPTAMLHGVARCLFTNPTKTGVRQMRADKLQFSFFWKVVVTWRFCWPLQLKAIYPTLNGHSLKVSKLEIDICDAKISAESPSTGFGLGTPRPLRLRSASRG